MYKKSFWTKRNCEYGILSVWARLAFVEFLFRWQWYHITERKKTIALGTQKATFILAANKSTIAVNKTS